MRGRPPNPPQLRLPASGIEAADDFFADDRLFRGISGLYHSFRHAREFFSRQPTFVIQLISEANHAQLFLRIEPLDFLDDLARGHSKSLSRMDKTIN
jgi:hypothetical protein